MQVEWEMAVRLIMSVILGGLIGYERQSHNKSAGLRTHILVCLGSCLIMILSIKIYASVQGLTNADPSRLAAQVVSGIGFLGAGSIIKDGVTIRGLTTAASLWVVSGVGLAVGSGYFMGALMTTGLILLTLTILARMENKDFQKSISLLVTTCDTPGKIGEIGIVLGKFGISIRDIKIIEQEEVLTISFFLKVPEHVNVNEVTTKLMHIQGITSVGVEY